MGVLSILDDKDAAGMLEALLPAFDRLVLTRCTNPRALSPGTLASLVEQLGGPDVRDGRRAARARVERARELAGPAGPWPRPARSTWWATWCAKSGAARASTM